MLKSIANLPDQRSAWAVLFLTAGSLILVAMYFQYGMGLEPCIKCIYQRTAVFGILAASLLPMIFNHWLTRLMGYLGWGVSAIWGLIIAIEHVDIQTAANPFFTTCEFVPNFPAFMPLHEWLPGLFAATGDCGDIDWQFVSLSMPQWMIIIFAGYALVFTLVLSVRLLIAKRL